MNRCSVSFPVGIPERPLPDCVLQLMAFPAETYGAVVVWALPHSSPATHPHMSNLNPGHAAAVAAGMTAHKVAVLA